MKLVFPAIVLLLAFAAKAEEMVVDGRTWSYTTYTNNGYEYLAEVTGVYPNGGDVVIPEQLRVGDQWSSVYASPVLIKQAVFEYCDTLESISIPDSVMYIDPYAFQFCTSLKSVKLAANLTEVGGCNFMCCTSLVSVKIPGNLKCIATDMFRSCYALEKVEIEEGVESVSGTAFDQCGNLTTVTIPSTLKNWSEFPRSVTTVYVSGGDTKRVKDMLAQQTYGLNVDEISFVEKSLPDGGPYEEIVDGVSYNFFIENREAKVEKNYWSSAIPYDTSGTVCVPQRLGGVPVTSIGRKAFYGCSSLTSVVIPEGVKRIGEQAFYECHKLESIEIPASVVEIDERAFMTCRSLRKITIPSGIKTISGGLFSYCFSLKEVVLPDDVTEIAAGAFYQCIALEGISMPTSLVKIGGSAFYLCHALSYIVLPNGLEEIGESAFYHCQNLSVIEIPTSVKFFGGGAFDGTPYYEKLPDGPVIFDKTLYKYKGRCPSVVKIPTGITAVASGAFEGSDTLASVEIPDTVTMIGDYAFWSCPNLSKVNIPNGVIAIGDGLFGFCAKLETVIIPNSVESIGNSAFNGCEMLCSITLPSKVKTIGEAAFNNCPKLKSINIPRTVNKIGYYAFDGYWLKTVFVEIGDIDRVMDLMLMKGVDGCPNVDKIVFCEQKQDDWSDVEVDEDSDMYAGEVLGNDHVLAKADLYELKTWANGRYELSSIQANENGLFAFDSSGNPLSKAAEAFLLNCDEDGVEEAKANFKILGMTFAADGLPVFEVNDDAYNGELVFQGSNDLRSWSDLAVRLGDDEEHPASEGYKFFRIQIRLLPPSIIP